MSDGLSGAHTANVAFSMPKQTTNPLLIQPILFFQFLPDKCVGFVGSSWNVWHDCASDD